MLYEALKFIVKDAILLVDDFAPRGNRSDIERWHQKAEPRASWSGEQCRGMPG
jgi:hypothetical protein